MKNAIVKRKYSENFSIVFESYNENATGFIRDKEQRKYSKATILVYLGALKDFFLFLDVKGVETLQEVTLGTLDLYRLYQTEKEQSSQTINMRLKTVRQFFKYLEKSGELFINPANDLKLRKPDNKMGYVPNEEDMKKLLNSPDVTTELGIRDRAIMESAYSTGMRLEELSSLNIFSFNLRNGSVRVFGKGGKERTLPLGKHACSRIGKYLRKRDELLDGNIDEKAFWISNYGTGMKKCSVGRVFSFHSKKAGVENISVHAIRRACATHMLRNGAHPVQIQMLLGHASLRTLSHYLKMTITELQETHSRSTPGH